MSCVTYASLVGCVVLHADTEFGKAKHGQTRENFSVDHLMGAKAFAEATVLLPA